MIGWASAGEAKNAAAKIAIKTRIRTPDDCSACLLVKAASAIKRGEMLNPAFKHLIGWAVAINPGTDVGDDLFAHRFAAFIGR